MIDLNAGPNGSDRLLMHFLLAMPLLFIGVSAFGYWLGRKSLAALVLVFLFALCLLVFIAQAAEAGCAEICREWPRPDYSQVNPHCCCEDFAETPCAAPTACVPGLTPTPLPTPEDRRKGVCCDEVGETYRAARRAIVKAKQAELRALTAWKLTEQKQCRGGY